jgi:hypothetical protein
MERVGPALEAGGSGRGAQAERRPPGPLLPRMPGGSVESVGRAHVL